MRSLHDHSNATALAKAQASNALQHIRLTVVSNAAIAASLAVLMYLDDGGTLIFWWLAAAVALAAIRAFWISRLAAAGIAESDPRRLLRDLTILAGVAGVLWGLVPLWFGSVVHKQNVDYMVFIMVGITTGGIIQSAAYYRVGLAFGGPVMISTLVWLISSGSRAGYIITLDGVFLTLMLFRAAMMGERSFVDSQVTALEATKLATSLARANDEVLGSYRALERIARTDPLTGLANRTHFRDASRDACASTRGVAFVLVDIDSFKTINDTRGHEAGDRVIEAVAGLLRWACKGDDLAVRLGGDEFIVVLQGDRVAERSVALAQALAAELKTPLIIAGQALTITCSIGIAAHPKGAIDAEDLFARADAALYRAKDDGRACTRVFDAQMYDEWMLQRLIDSDLEGALAHGRLHLEFQPQVAMATREVIGFEALLRWCHPSAGLIPPPEIVQSALRLQLSKKLLAFIGERACEFLRALDESGAPGLKVSVNVSPREMAHSPGRILKELTQRFGVDPQRIEIEITEEALFDPKQCARELERIDQAGFALAIDDFGIGHSSIANLMTIEIDSIKIDRSFVHGITRNYQNQQLIGAIAAVAQPLGHRIIAEGVETEDEADTLRLLGCSFGQGWLYGRPMPQAAAIAWLEANAREASLDAAV